MGLFSADFKIYCRFSKWTECLTRLISFFHLKSILVVLNLSTLLINWNSLGLYCFFTGKRRLCPLLWCSNCKNPEEDTRSNRLYVHLHCSIRPWQHWGDLWFLFFLIPETMTMSWPFMLSILAPFFGLLLGKIFDINTIWCCFICPCQEGVSFDRICCRPTQEESACYPDLALDPTSSPSLNVTLNTIESLWG